MAGVYNDMPPLVDSNSRYGGQGDPFPHMAAQFPGGGGPPPGGGFPIYNTQNDPYYGGGAYPGGGGYGYPPTSPYGADPRRSPRMGQMPAGYPVPIIDGRPDWSQQPSGDYPQGYGYDNPQVSSPFLPRTPLQRTHSHFGDDSASSSAGWAAPPSPSHSLMRSHGRRSSFNSGARPHHKVPTDWREDFQMPGSQGLARLFSISKRLLGGGTQLHETLEYKSPSVITWDMRFDPAYMRPAQSSSPRPYAHMELMESATDPPSQSLRLFHPLLPWYIPIESPANTVITIHQLVQTIFFQIRRSISEEDYYNDDVEQTDRERIYNAYVERCRRDVTRTEYGYGVRRIDYLGDSCWFIGLKKRGDDLWEIKTTDIESLRRL